MNNKIKIPYENAMRAKSRRGVAECFQHMTPPSSPTFVTHVVVNFDPINRTVLIAGYIYDVNTGQMKPAGCEKLSVWDVPEVGALHDGRGWHMETVKTLAEAVFPTWGSVIRPDRKRTPFFVSKWYRPRDRA